jgi:Zn-dependent metalloprotease
VQASATGAKAAAPGESLVQQMKNEAQGSVALSAESATGKVGFIRAGAKGDLMPSVQATSQQAAVKKTTTYLDQYGAAFGAAKGELRQAGVLTSKYGWTVTYQQFYKGVPVFGSMIKANVDKAGDLTSVNGFAAPGLSLSTTPKVSASDAAARAIATVRANPPGEGATDVSGVKAANQKLTVYRLGSTKGEAGKAVLAYAVEVTNERNVRDMVILDATTNKPLNRYSMMHGLETDRELYEDSPASEDLVWKEGDPFPGTLNEDQQNLVNTTGDAYWLFANTFGRDSYDGQGATMKTVNNDPRIQCPNANWNGVTTNYCNGVTSDDVVAHEWGHAYTEYTSGLIYQYQSGALNESYSDVWGETVDLINDRDDEGEVDAPRVVGQCSKYTRSDVELEINAPASIARVCEAAPAAFGPVFDQAGTTSDLVVGTDADEDGAGTAATTTDGCSAFDNAAEIDGIFVYVDRGACTFQTKVDNAEAAGATGIVVGNHTAGQPPFPMSGTADIYGVMIGVEDGAAIKSATETVNVTVRDIDTATKDDSHRWLVSEKSPAFGGAIRDMWNPTCYGDPGKVTDAEYVCGTDDNGGVHGNSGVPNHAYALAVDGGTFNGVAVDGIGLDKAAQVWWRTQSAYLTPTSNFVDFADGLDQACQDLIGKPILKLDVTPNALGEGVERITAEDCDQVAAAGEAVELRFDPTEQCEWEPLLKKGGPAACGKRQKTVNVWKENFNDGLRGWRKTEDVVFDGAHGVPWQASNAAPNHNSGVAFAPDPLEDGSCDGSADDLSSRNSIISPRVKLPTTGRAPKLVFNHYVATEIGFDGGNLKIKVNRGGFQPVPEDAFIFNPYNSELETAAAGNTNPMAGEPAFTGTNGGSAFGSWGKTQINLRKLGVGRGDRVKIRFDFGRDGCGGNDGWYVDDVKVVVCKNKRNRTLATRS